MRCAVAAWLTIFFLVCSPVWTWGEEAKISTISHAALLEGDMLRINAVSVASPHIFLIDGDNPRLVLDFPESGYLGKHRTIATPEGNLLKGVRVGIHHDPVKKVRLVADLKGGSPIAWEQNYDPANSIFTLTILPAEAAGSRQEEAPAVPEEAPLTEAGDQAAPTQVLTATATKVKPAPATEGEAVESEEYPEEIVQEIPKPEPKVDAVVAANEGHKDADGTVESAEEAAIKVPVLTSMSFDNAFSQSGEMVLLQLSDFEPPKISTQEKDPPRIFCDFVGAEVGEGVKDIIDAGGQYVESITIKSDELGVRVILDLVPGANYDLQQVYFKEDNLFVLIVNTLAPENNS